VHTHIALSATFAVFVGAAVAAQAQSKPHVPPSPHRADCIEYLRRYQLYLGELSSRRTECSRNKTGREGLVRTGPCCSEVNQPAADQFCWSLIGCDGVDEAYSCAEREETAEFARCLGSIAVRPKPSTDAATTIYFRDLVDALKYPELTLIKLRSNYTFTQRLSTKLTKESLATLKAIRSAALDELLVTLDQFEETDKR
jgi:hypothetical protein